MVKRKQKWISTNLPVKGNKKNADKILRETLLKCEDGYEIERTQISPKNILFYDYVEDWFQTAKLHIDLVTWEGYATTKLHIFPYFKKLNLNICDVTAAHIQKYYN
jgi:hypothetical protein